MPRQKFLRYGQLLRLTAAQIDWLREKSEQLDRPVAWVMRDILDGEIARERDKEMAQAPPVRMRRRA